MLGQGAAIQQLFFFGCRMSTTCIITMSFSLYTPAFELAYLSVTIFCLMPTVAYSVELLVYFSLIELRSDTKSPLPALPLFWTQYQYQR